MAGNRSEFYRGKRKKTGPALIVSIVVLSLIAFVVLLFYGLQKYIVVTNSGLHLDLPILAGTKTSQTGNDDSAVREFETVNAELIVGEPDYTNVRATAGEGLTELKAVLVPADQVNADSVNAYADSIGKGNTLMLDLKTVTGMLVWKSETEIAKGYGTTGTVDLKPIITALHEKDIKVAARLCCFVDNTLASRYEQLALHKSTGEAFSDDNGAWLDPSNSIVRDYIVSLCKELDAMGVDEILLNGMRMPETEGVTYAYSSTHLGHPHAADRHLRLCDIRHEDAQEHERKSLRAGRQRQGHAVGRRGHRAECTAVFKIFDRVYRTSSADTAGDEQKAVKSMIELGELKYRYVPIVYDALPGTTCWMKLN